MKLITLKHILYVTAFVAGGFMMTSCQDKGFDWDKAHAQKINDKTEAAFAEAFEQIFGKIDPNQSWDFTVDNTKATRASGNYYTLSNDYYEVKEKFSKWMDDNMKEGDNNTEKGVPLTFTMPGDGIIDLIPVYQGAAVSSWDMHMVVTPLDKEVAPIDINFWSRNKGLEVEKYKVNWAAKTTKIRSERDGKYLYFGPNAFNYYDNCDLCEITKGSSAGYWENQFYIKLNRKLVAGEKIYMSLRYKVSINSHISLDFHSGIGTNNGTSRVNFEFCQTRQTYDFPYIEDVKEGDNTAKLSTNSDWDMLCLQFTVPQNADNFEYICLNLEDGDTRDGSTTNKYGFKDGFIKNANDTTNTSIISWTAESFVYRKNGNNVDKNSTSNKSYSSSYHSIDLVNPNVHGINFATDKENTTDNPYQNTNEMGYNFSVVSVETSDGKQGKYLLAYRDLYKDGTIQAGIVSVANSNQEISTLKFLSLDDIASAQQVVCYEAPYMDKYLMIGNYLICNDPTEGLIAKNISNFRNSSYNGNTEPYPWNVSDEFRSTLVEPKNGYRWRFEVRDAYEAEKRVVGCNSDGNEAISGAYSNNLYTTYSNGTKTWMPVKLDYDENTMGWQKAKKTRANHFLFDFKSSLGSDFTKYKKAVISFYWETLTPQYRRNDARGKYLYSDAEYAQMRSITAANANEYKVLKDAENYYDNVVAVGCEAGICGPKDNIKLNDPGNDADFNDVVFLMATNNSPIYVDKTSNEYIKQKRYMVEDLGSTDDIDFNDMVVDVIETTPYEIKTTTIDDKTTTETTYGETTQKVIVRAVGGTLPFDFCIGVEGNYKTIFSKSQLTGVNVKGMYNTGCGDGSTSAENNEGLGSIGPIDYDKSYGEFTIPDNVWDYDSNNVMFRVYRKNTYYDGDNLDDLTNAYYTHDITFPKLGETPHIIAFPVDKLWRNERRLCCWDWINDNEPSLWEEPENKKDGTYNQAHNKTFKEWYKEGNNSSDFWNFITKFDPTTPTNESTTNKMETWFKKAGITE